MRPRPCGPQKTLRRDVGAAIVGSCPKDDPIAALRHCAPRRVLQLCGKPLIRRQGVDRWAPGALSHP
jgi:hypothetical protein